MNGEPSFEKINDDHYFNKQVQSFDKDDNKLLQSMIIKRNGDVLNDPSKTIRVFSKFIENIKLLGSYKIHILDDFQISIINAFDESKREIVKLIDSNSSTEKTVFHNPYFVVPKPRKSWFSSNSKQTPPLNWFQIINYITQSCSFYGAPRSNLSNGGRRRSSRRRRRRSHRKKTRTCRQRVHRRR